MRFNKLSIPLVSLVSLVLGCGGSPSEEDTTPQDQDASVLQEGLDELHAAGISGLLAELNDGDQRTLARSGVARLDSDEPVHFDSYFRMGSNTKTFVSVVVLQLVGEGGLTLEDSVDQWLPGVVSGNGHDGEQVTIRQLLQHTSGIFSYTADPEVMDAISSADAYLEHRLDHMDPEDLVAIAMQHGPDFPPGAGWKYSNTNYVLAGMVIESVTGNGWVSEVESRILDPLGLEHTFDPGDEPDLPSPHATGYEQFTSGAPLLEVTTLNHTWADAAGSLVTTTADLSKFWRALQQGELLEPEQMAELQKSVPAPPFDAFWPGVGYGLGIMWIPMTCGGGYWSHGGDTLGFATRNAASEDGSRVAILSLSTQPFDAKLPVIQQSFKLLDQLMCAD